MTLKQCFSEWTNAFTSLTKNAGLNGLIILTFFAIITVNDRGGGDPYRDGKLIVFVLAALLASSLWICQRFDVFLGLLHATLSISWFWHYGPAFGLLVVAGMPMMLFLATAVTRNEWLFFHCLRTAAWVQVALCWFHQLGFETFPPETPFFRYLLFGSMGHPIVLAAFLAMLIPVSIKRWTRIETAVILFYCLYANSTCATVGLMAGSLYWLFRRSRVARIICCTIAPLLAVILAIGVYMYPSIEFFSLSGRMLPWKRAWELILENPWGYGPGSWFGLYGQWEVPYKEVWDFLHNDALQLIFEGGWLSFGLAIISSYTILRKLETWAACSFVIILVNAFGAFPFHLVAINFTICAILISGGLRHGKSPSSS